MAQTPREVTAVNGCQTRPLASGPVMRDDVHADLATRRSIQHTAATIRY